MKDHARPRIRSTRRGLLAAALLALSQPLSAAVFINELHYDNAGADVGEAVEVVATGGESLAGYTVVLYNGPQVYGTVPVPAGALQRAPQALRPRAGEQSRRL